MSWDGKERPSWMTPPGGSFPWHLVDSRRETDWVISRGVVAIIEEDGSVHMPSSDVLSSDPKSGEIFGKKNPWTFEPPTRLYDVSPLVAAAVDMTPLVYDLWLDDGCLAITYGSTTDTYDEEATEDFKGKLVAYINRVEKDGSVFFKTAADGVSKEEAERWMASLYRCKSRAELESIVLRVEGWPAPLGEDCDYCWGTGFFKGYGKPCDEEGCGS